MIDDFNREALGIEADFSLLTEQLSRAVEQIIGHVREILLQMRAKSGVKKAPRTATEEIAMFAKYDTEIPECFIIKTINHKDQRGKLMKVFAHQDYTKLGLTTEFEENFYTTSKKGVLRGMHFQIPPFDYEKVVYCICGKVFDVLLDLRVGSPKYGKAVGFYLDSDSENILYVAKGVAHGFCVVSEQATMGYLVSKNYSPEHDEGVCWSSLNIDWPVQEPVLSQRDRSFPSLAEYKSPFSF